MTTDPRTTDPARLILAAVLDMLSGAYGAAAAALSEALAQIRTAEQSRPGPRGKTPKITRADDALRAMIESARVSLSGADVRPALRGVMAFLEASEPRVPSIIDFTGPMPQDVDACDMADALGALLERGSGFMVFQHGGDVGSPGGPFVQYYVDSKGRLVLDLPTVGLTPKQAGRAAELMAALGIEEDAGTYDAPCADPEDAARLGVRVFREVYGVKGELLLSMQEGE